MISTGEASKIADSLFDAAIWDHVIRNDMKCMVIFENQAPYLARFYVQRRPNPLAPAVYLHYFFASDEKDSYHNHPWEWAKSKILTRGYREHRLFKNSVVSYEYLPSQWNVIYPDTFHRVDILGPGTWSLFIAGPRIDTWGFKDQATGEVEDWKIRNARVKRERDVEKMSAQDPRILEYREESLKNFSSV